MLNTKKHYHIKTKKLKACLMKFDLRRAFDCVDWEFLRLILYKIDFKHRHVQWVLACISSMSMAILINGRPSNSSKLIEASNKAVHYLLCYLNW